MAVVRAGKQAGQAGGYSTSLFFIILVLVLFAGSRSERVTDTSDWGVVGNAMGEYSTK